MDRKENRMKIDDLLRELERLEHTDAATKPAPEPLQQFAVRSVSPIAVDQMQIVPLAPKDPTLSVVFAAPCLRSPTADRTHVKQQLEKELDVGKLLMSAGNGFLANDSRKSRTFEQLPMAPARMELVPKRHHLVMAPYALEYEYRAVDTSHAGANAGFAGSLTKHSASYKDEYARGKMSNAPFSPGGETLAENEVTKSEKKHETVMTDVQNALDAIVLEDSNASYDEDYETLEKLVIKAPGMDNCLTLNDVLDLQKAKAQSPHGQEQDDEEEEDPVTQNASSVLQSYMGVMKDPEAIRSMLSDVQSTAALRKLEKESTSVALEQLFHDMQEDDDLNELGFDLNQEEEEAQATEPAEAPVEAKSHDEPEHELESLLSELAPSKRSNASSEYASLERIDVRNFHERVPEMAMAFTFELDAFQKECIVHLEQHECVFVAAHTSAGKTVVAEYAIAMSQKHMTRTIYTSPIKALSNQKYRDFRSKYGPDQVGLITGDVSINPEASCLVMTTEILRSMLYRGADVIRDIEWVVFDEIHYINDSERGVVWEEVIIMLPEHIGMVFLSATTPNHLEFSDWIGRTKKKKIHVISTSKRPVPLEHFLYANKEFFKVYDATSGYVAGAYGAAKQKLFPPSDKKALGNQARGGSSSARTIPRTSGGDQSDWTKLINVLKDKTLLPVVVFAFSKRLCEESASKLSKLDLSTPSERSEIHLFLEQSIQRLHGSDRELPQVLTMKEMLKRGIGVHHGGLLPILKEMVEILFARGLVKVLFSTETFAMGVNMPARTVVFNGIRKHDGKNFRDLLPGEYTQMAGRAGRRGLDTVGTVIIACWNDLPDPTALQHMMAGKALPLNSQFRLTYNMILNLLRVEVLTVEDMMKRSFSEFHTQKELASRKIPQLIAKANHVMTTMERSLTSEYAHLDKSGELQTLRTFGEHLQQQRTVEKRLVKWILSNVAVAKAAVTPGRLLVVTVKGLPSEQLVVVLQTTNVRDNDSYSTGVGMERFQSTDAADAKTTAFKSITVLARCPDDYEPPESTSPTTAVEDTRHLHNLNRLRSKRDEENDRLLRGGRATNALSNFENALALNKKQSLVGKSYVVFEIPESCIDSVLDSSFSLSLHPTSSKKDIAAALEALDHLSASASSSPAKTTQFAFIDLIHELKVHQLDVANVVDQWHQLHQLITTKAAVLQSTSYSQRALDKVDQILKLQAYLHRMMRELSNDSLQLFPDFQQRLSVLKRLGYLSADGDVVQVKGRVACEINTCDEILLTEIIFENVLATLEPEEIVAVLSALIFQEKTQSEPKLTVRLEHAKETVQLIAESLGLIQLEHQLDLDPAIYCKNALNFGLIEVVYEWARGMPFKKLCELTDIPEGSIVRCITRLDEVCREVRNAARVIGDPRLFRKMEVASEAIKRDVVFASSLYLS